MHDTILHGRTTIKANGHGMRLRKYVMVHYRHIVTSKENAHQSFKRGEVSVNGQPSEETRILQEGDVIEINYNKTKEQLQKLKDIPVEVVYQDMDMAIIWKPPGINNHIFDKAIQYSFENHSSFEEIWTPYSLQKAASGFLLVAKTALGKERMNQQYKEGAIQLGMHVLCHGQVPPDLPSMAMPEKKTSVDEETSEKGLKKDSSSDQSSKDNVTQHNKGQPKAPDGDNDDEEEEEEGEDNNDDTSGDDTNLFNSFNVLSVTRSNNSDYLSTVALGLKTPWSSAAVRRYFFHRGYTIIGNSAATRPLKTHRDKGLYMSLVSVSMNKLIVEQQQEGEEGEESIKSNTIHVQRDEPEKFKLIRNREQRFWQRACERRMKEMKQAGVLMEGTDYSVDIVENYGKEPLAYILGEKEFCGLRFEINRSVLIPRPSSETLVEAAITWLRQSSSSSSPSSASMTEQSPTSTREKRPIKVVDIGTGCGNLLISILDKVPQAIGIGVDISEQALEVARKNQQQLLANKEPGRAQFILKDMATLTTDDLVFTPSIATTITTNGKDDNLITGLADLIVCNPPYLNMEQLERQRSTSKDQRTQQQLTLSYEPSEALYAGEQGFGFYRTLSEVVPRVLALNGRVILECGKGMMDRILLIFSGWNVVATVKDKQGWDRCLVLERKG